MQDSFIRAIEEPAKIEGDFLTVLPSHCTHGCQAMDCKGGPIQICKANLSPILQQQFQAAPAHGLGKPELIWCLYMSWFGGKYYQLSGHKAETTIAAASVNNEDEQRRTVADVPKSP